MDNMISGVTYDETAKRTQTAGEEDESNIMYIDEMRETGDTAKWLKSIELFARGAAAANIRGSPNKLYCVEFATFVLKLSRTLVLWSSTCAKIFDAPVVASTMNVESFFNVYKMSLAKFIPCRADHLIMQDINLISGMIIDASQSYINIVDVGRTIVAKPESAAKTTQPESAAKSTKPKSAAKPIKPSALKNPCPLCEARHLPGGAHVCVFCNAPVHIIGGCSTAIEGEQEGYGERRICFACNSAKSADDAEVASETVTWQRKSKRELRSQHSYLSPQPHWRFLKDTAKKLELAVLQNASSSTTWHMVNKQRTKLKNSCAFDSLAQVLTIYTTSIYIYTQLTVAL